MASFYCRRSGGMLMNFYRQPRCVAMYGVDKKDILAVEVEEDEGGGFWAAIRDDGEFEFVYASEIAIRMCYDFRIPKNVRVVPVSVRVV